MFSPKARGLTYFLLILIPLAVIGGFFRVFPTTVASGTEKTADAIVLLAGDREERTATVVDLFLSGRAQTVILTNDGIISSWSQRQERNLTEIEWTEEHLADGGIPRERIGRLPYYRSGTVYDALAVQRYLETHPVRRILLVTSDYHARRALWIFQQVFSGRLIEISAAPARTSRLQSWKERVIEAVKIVIYWYRYRNPDQLPDLPAGNGSAIRG